MFLIQVTQKKEKFNLSRIFTGRTETHLCAMWDFLKNSTFTHFASLNHNDNVAKKRDKEIAL
ncbi:hypothetical protein A8O28_22945 [Enterobacteriaceae bacterium CCUG 67584]|nr:hypothetical protein [Enterobacteriaceae bacterium CCUG 67584]